MSAVIMPRNGSNGIGHLDPSWQRLIYKKQNKTIYRIILRVRGKEIVKQYVKRQEFLSFREAYRLQMEKQTDGAIEEIREEIE